MPIKTAAKKALRQAAKRKLLNDKLRNDFKYLVKKCRKAIEVKKKKDAQNFFQKATQSLDKAAKRNILSKNTAGRLKSRLATKINAL